MTEWPKAQIIRVKRAHRKYYGPIDPTLAFKYPNGSYLLLTDGPDEGYLSRCRGDSIDEWEDFIPVPASDVVNLRDSLRGASLSERQLAAVLKITSCLKSAEPSPLDRAVSLVKELLEGPRTSIDTSSERYLSLLLGSLATFQKVEHGPRLQAEKVLATIVRICVQWVAEVCPSGSQFTLRSESEVLAEVRARVESDPAVWGFPSMAALAGDSAAWVDEARETAEGQRRLANGLAGPVLAIAHYALARLAKCLEDGE